jgi:PAS domain-containing protein
LYHNFEIVHPDDLDRSLNEIVKLEKGEAIFEFENRYLTKDGEIVWLSWTSNSSTEGCNLPVAKYNSEKN